MCIPFTSECCHKGPSYMLVCNNALTVSQTVIHYNRLVDFTAMKND